MDTEKLVEAVLEKATTVSSDKLAYSVRELRSMYTDGQINVEPDFQRAYRWSAKQRSSLIESMLLSIPLPPVFVSQDDEGNWDVIDGVQRLTTIISFMDTPGMPFEAFPLESLEYLSELEGLKWNELPLALQRRIEQTRIDVTIVDSTSSKDAKYNLFLRLNAGSVLSQQELRNCMLVMVNKAFFQSVKELSDYPAFRKIASISEKRAQEGFYDELVLRFFMQADFSGPEKPLKEDFGEALTEWAHTRAGKPNFLTDERLGRFRACCDLVLKAGGEEALRRWSPKARARRGGFSNAAFEFVFSGLAQHLEHWQAADETELSQKLIDFWTFDGFEKNVGSGKNARDRFPVLVNQGRKYFQP